MRAPSVHEQPDVALHDWIAAEACGLFFLVGYQTDSNTLRLSTPLASIDTGNLECRTQSGRHYLLSMPHAGYEVSQCLLLFFLASMGVKAIDSTKTLLNNPQILYTSFLLMNESGHLERAKSRLEAMSAAPLQWLHEFVDTLTKCGVDSSLFKTSLDLCENDWQLFKEEKLTSVSIETSFRGLILHELIEYTMGLNEMSSALQAGRSYRCDNELRQQITDLLSMSEMHELLETFRPCHGFRARLPSGQKAFFQNSSQLAN